MYVVFNWDSDSIRINTDHLYFVVDTHMGCIETLLGEVLLDYVALCSSSNINIRYSESFNVYVLNYDSIQNILIKDKFLLAYNSGRTYVWFDGKGIYIDGNHIGNICISPLRFHSHLKQLGNYDKVTCGYNEFVKLICLGIN